MYNVSSARITLCIMYTIAYKKAILSCEEKNCQKGALIGSIKAKEESWIGLSEII